MSRVRITTWLSLTALALSGLTMTSSAYAQAVAPKDPSVKIDGEYATGLGNGFLPTNVSEHGGQIDRLIHVMHGFMAVLFIAWGIFFVYCLLRFRQRSGHRASCELIKAKPSKYAEIGVAIFEAVLLIGFAMPVWASVKTQLPKPEENPINVRVLAEQFAWNFHYPGADGKFGKTAPEHVNTATNPLGLDRSDPHAADDVYAGELHLPAGKPVIAELASKDVIHSFFIPVMRVKQDTIPGMRIPIWFKSKADSAGTYEIACAQLCGNNHYSMRAVLYLESEEKYNAWLAAKSAPPVEFEE